MPQIFPMNWFLMSSSIMLILIFTVINFYFFSVKTPNKNTFNINKMTKYSFKW
uniref:ATP synthase F0 subunit 8 n=1 Tax=Rhipicephalus linnaei TaxID=2138177 RepID=UPI001BEE167C|nr:ATP synthase F0 subunit 8 [Rhipicephalus linnaei]UNO54420.1 ATP synthase F0 subunit 8 [Rhipicephalus sanguineus]QTZ18349.1 ATP synthase F0 subunit 8 [Rhipicephalus linnaei]QTZ18362.1 ATP synthase F0 subunit 8 [Rhipicephalus linnaei]QTZ18375.1 ATP synthase F0 subunit 8 [Rhipicephalus linnaei]UNO54433.1 ATP synthase F0 subunit 8 [Rhipicephalus sanguineus]